MESNNKLYDFLERQILAHELKAHDKIMSENQLRNKFFCSRNFVRDTLKQLINDGYLYSVQGKGYFVNFEKYWLKNLSWKRWRPKENRRNLLLDFQIELPTWFRENYRLNPQDFTCFTKGRILNGENYLLIYVFLNNQEIKKFDVDAITESVLFYLKEMFDFQISYNFFQVETANEKEAEFLKIKPGDQVIVKYSVIYHKDQKVIQCSLDKQRLKDFKFGYVSKVF